MILLALLLAVSGEYVIQPGDTCVKVAQKVYGDAQATDRLHALNAMGPPPHHLVPGKRLRIEIDPDARLTYVKPDVNHKKAGAGDWGPAAQGQDLFRLDQVNTLKGAGAEVTFRDQSALQIRESALVVINGRGAGPGSTESKSGSVSLVQGELRLKLAQMRGETPVAIGTPAGKVAARQGDVTLGVDAQKTSRVSVFEGAADVSAAGRRVTVPRGQGTRVENGKPPEPPRPLPEAPQWAGKESLFLGAAELSWKPAARADRYVLLVARDGRFLDVAAQVSGTEVRASVPLAAGRYLARVQAIDAAGLQGPPSEARELVVAVAQLESVPGEVRVKLRGPQVPEGPGMREAALELLLDGAPGKDERVVHAPGDHMLAVRAGGEERSLRFEVTPPQVEAELVPGQDDFVLRLSLPPALPVEPLTFETRAKVTAIERLPDGTIHGLVSPAEGTRSAALVVLWAGQRVAQAEATLLPPPPKPEPAPEPRVSDEDVVGEPVAIEADALPAARPALRNGVRARLQLADLTTLDPRFDTRIDLRVGKSALGSVSYTASAQQGTLSAFTLRLQAVDAPRGLTAGAALTVPTRGDETVRARVFAGRGKELGALELETTQALAVGLGHGARIAWDSGYSAQVHVRPWLSLSLGVDAIVGEVPRLGTVIAPAGAAGLRVRRGPFEAGLSARLSLGSDADAVWSRSAVLLGFGLDAGPP